MLSDTLQDLAASIEAIRNGAARSDDPLTVDPEFIALLAANVAACADQARCLEAGILPVSDPAQVTNIVPLFPNLRGPAA